MLDKTTKPPCLFKLTWNAKHGLPLMKERKEKKKKSCSPYLSNKAGKQNIKYAVVAEAAKTGSYKLKAEKMAASIKTRQDPFLLPTPRHFSGWVLSLRPLPHPVKGHKN